MTSLADRPVRVALLGRGTVGTALHHLLVEHRQHIRDATGRDVDVDVVLVRDASRPRDGVPPGTTVVDSIADVVAREPDVVCEAMGGVDPTREHLLAFLDRGIPVVTANKQLVARHGTELFARAEHSGAQLRFEASVCGAVPIIRMLRESLAATRIDELLGILNGTTNFMLTAMTRDGADYSDVLATAQRLGYAEPDPTEDVGGIDAAAKLAILAGIAFGTTVDINDVPVRGITAITADDVRHANVLGCRIKLVGRASRQARRTDGAGIAIDVTPMLIPESHPLAAVSGATNAVLVDGSPFGRLVVQGAGAGGPETASALAGDLVSVLGSEPSFLTRDPHVAHLPVAPGGTRVEPHYARMTVADRPGVLAAVAGALAGSGISIERVIQQRSDDANASLVLTTHPCTFNDLASALDTVQRIDGTVMPILDQPEPM